MEIIIIFKIKAKASYFQIVKLYKIWKFLIVRFKKAKLFLSLLIIQKLNLEKDYYRIGYYILYMKLTKFKIDRNKQKIFQIIINFQIIYKKN